MDDWDQGSGGVVLLPDQPASGPHQHLLLQASKDGTIYLLNRDSLGGYNTVASAGQELQSITGALNSMHGTPAWWNNAAYFGADSDYLKAFPFDPVGGTLDFETSKSPNQFGTQAPRHRYPPTGRPMESFGLWTAARRVPAARRFFTPTTPRTWRTNFTPPRKTPPATIPEELSSLLCRWSATGKFSVGTQAQLSVFGPLSSPLAGVSVNPSPVTGGASATGTVTLNPLLPLAES